MGSQLKAASFAMAEAQYSAGDFKIIVLEKDGTATVKVRTQTDNVDGVAIPKFERSIEGGEDRDYLGIAKGGHAIQNCHTGVPEVSGDVGIAGLIAVRVRNSGRGDYPYRRACECQPGCGAPSGGEHDRLHQVRAGRA
eukprot:EC715387.1.p1 GENE.EC715387.1~~EC715387.1.p1  ORF type:complete len:138 (+),score=16.29 EC715387.1:187-600(+)